MGAQGTVLLDFGAFPGASDASVPVAETGVSATSAVEAWIRPEDTADHTVDEHMVETFQVFAHTPVAGVGFTVRGFNTSQVNEPLEDLEDRGFSPANILATGPYSGKQPSVGGRGTRIYGKWRISWVWN